MHERCAPTVAPVTGVAHVPRLIILLEQLLALGFKPLPGETPIVPVILGETAKAIRMSELLLAEGVFVTGFGYPIVPALYMAICAIIMLALLVVKPIYSWPSFLIVLTGIPVYFLWRGRKKPV